MNEQSHVTGKESEHILKKTKKGGKGKRGDWNL